MLALNRSLLTKEYTLISIPMSLASIISMCSLHVTFFSKITPIYFTLFTNGIFRPCGVRRDPGDQWLQEKKIQEYFPHSFKYSGANVRPSLR
jgi:hypothetical protein